ncbi:FtsK/SpoIIIE domain-containing protein [Mycolicibacterium neoaurum]|uniref:FtsK/SpoIIIE domain-containing protein n=1 Tax=Mycolicibacterium neoaurum TaxID=1795 RepID=UPI00248AE2D7|nr:FtsK/SpoIIIE domain-containing protein [Mycolicibacterium neoaurum]WBP93212.1 FtsK/SpoIIIE domain-containing protein [Mycolicibacterium neoaurum]WBS06821.1 FtsK/SpoIIIE domain-containing protein [Mycolicibacterium neoaurum]
MRLYLDGEPYAEGANCSIEYSAVATVREVRDALAQSLKLSNDFILVDGRISTALNESSTFHSAQLEHGQIIELADVTRIDNKLKSISDADVARLVHVTGPQLGYSWPIMSGTETCFRIGSQRLIPASLEEASVSFSIAQDGRNVLVRQLDDQIRVRIDGRDIDSDATTAHIGSTIQITVGSEDLVAELRIVLRDEHELRRSANSSVAYRVRATNFSEFEVVPQTFRLTPPSPPQNPEWDWVDNALLDGSMVVVYLLLALSGSFSILVLAFIALPIGRFLLRYRRHRNDIIAAQERSHEALMAFDRELGILECAVREEAIVLVRRNPTLQIASHEALVREGRLWHRRHDRPAFLQIEAGRGVYQTPSTAEIAGKQTDPAMDVWIKDRDNIRLIANTPIEVDLSSTDLAIVGPRESGHQYLANLLLRICLLHSPNEVAIAALLPTDRHELQRLEWLRWLPHAAAYTALFDSNRFPSGPKECQAAIQSSIALLRDGAPGSSHIIVIVHDASGVDVSELKRYRSMTKGRIHLLWLGASEGFPDYFSSSIALETVESERQHVPALFRPTMHQLQCALTDSDESIRIAASIASLVDESGFEANQAIARTVPLMSVLDVRDDQLDLGRRTAEHELIAGIGEISSGIFELDLVAQGPHVLIAGTTGSGKSELLKSLTLSLAARYEPKDLSLLLVDFKGGASFHELAQLPHCIGGVSNLDRLEVDRVLRFLQAEIERRQRILARYQGEYSNYYRAKPGGLPRLVLVIDEFQGFVQDDNARRESAILNVAARGRSLGVHLIIATQSPRGVVTGQVRANVNARICLRVLDSSESEQVIDSPIAAAIPRDLKGRAYLRSESGTLIEFQSAWTGSISSLAASSIVVTTKDVFKPATRPHDDRLRDNRPTDFTVALSAIGDEFTPVADLPRLRASLLLASTERIKPGNREADADLSASEVLLGLKDDPGRQRQHNLYVDLAKGGLLLTGPAASGRTAALTALAQDFAMTHRRCQIVVIDGGGGDLTARLGGVVEWSIDATDRANVSHLLAQLTENYGAKTAPVLLLIDRIDVLQDVLGDFTTLCRTIASGGRQNILCAATNDLHLDTDIEIRRAFSLRLSFVPDHEGILVEDAQPSSLIKVAHPSDFTSRCENPRDKAQGGTWLSKFPQYRSYDSTGNWRPFGVARIPEDVSPVALVEDAGVLLGIDQTRYESVYSSIGAGLAIAGDHQSGKSSLLRILAVQVAHKSEKKIPVLTKTEIDPNSDDWAVDLRSIWNCAYNHHEDYIRALESDEAIDRIIFVDDIDEIERILHSIPLLPSTFVGPLLHSFNDQVNAGVWKIVATGPFACFTSSRFLPVGDDVLSYRNQLVNLQPPAAHLTPVWSGFDMQTRGLVTNITDKNYAVGEAAYVHRGRRREIQIPYSAPVTTSFTLAEDGAP